MFFGGDAGRADDSGKTIRSDPDDSLVLVLVINQRGDRPYLDGMAGRKRGASAPEVAPIFFVGTVAAENFFGDADDDEAVEQSLGSKHTDLAPFRIVAPRAINVRTGNDGNERVVGTDVRDAATPSDLAVAVVE